MLQLGFILDGAENFFSRLLHRLEDGHFQILLAVVGFCGNQRVILRPVDLHDCQDFQYIFHTIFIGDGDDIVTKLFAHGYLQP